MGEVILPLLFDVCHPLFFLLIMNIIIWNSRGSLKPNFQSYVSELAHNHNPAILVVMETKLGGNQVKEITDRLLFDRVIHTDTIGYARACGCYGIQINWRSR